MDIDRGPVWVNGNNQIPAGQTITWSGINVLGKTGLSFKGLFGANTTGIFQGTFFPGFIDSMVVEYRFNGVGAWTKVVGIFSKDATANGGPLGVDADNDRVGDGPALTLNLTEASGNITGTGNTLDLRFSIFDNNTGEGAMAIDNFRLFESIPLSVSLASFEALKDKSTADLRWTTETESDNTGFDIQRSIDGKTFETIGHVATKAIDGNSVQRLSYNFQDKAPANGVNLYRLAEKDREGHIVYSDVRSLNFEKDATFHCYPNPVRHQLTIEYNAMKAEQVSVSMTDFMGKAVITRSVNMQKGFNKTNIDMSALSQGMYNLRVVSASGVVHISKVAKQ
ncbi:MAG: T9SS type A sorting domain-containing protein [Chitinophagaceae bacterium]|nr:MAG: T9SS type A sorting domain-containing protein [Chitinophagaceae bacterium]